MYVQEIYISFAIWMYGTIMKLFYLFLIVTEVQVKYLLP